ncbi:MAG TPA: hypothetical protein VFO34_09695 [Candidatus Acidoferrales bacterium]|nr:hypothetical protein [Candidatus Acidoferrales bacterium]
MRHKFLLEIRAKSAHGIIVSLLAMCCCAGANPQSQARPEPAASAATVVFWEDGFPAIDTSAPTRAQLAALLPRATFADSAQLPDVLKADASRVLVLPFGSAFPEEDWPAINSFLAAGGNLLVIGGRPFTRAAYNDAGQWHARAPNQSFARSLFLNGYDETDGSAQLAFTANPDFASLKLPGFSWKRAWSATVRLSDENLYPREGSAGSIDARLDSLAWGTANGRKLAAPIIQIDHLHNQFTGGRWILLPAELGPEFWSNDAASKVIPLLADRAAQGAEELRVRPESVIVGPGEEVTLNVYWNRTSGKPSQGYIDIRSARCEATVVKGIPLFGKPLAEALQSGKLLQSIIERSAFPLVLQTTIRAPHSGFCSLTATLRDESGTHLAHTGFWVRDAGALNSGPKVGVTSDGFTLDGKPILVAGTTYMASDVQRQFLSLPNPYVWDRDMAEIEAAGLNTIRTGLWTGWDQFMKQPGEVNEQLLQSLEAFFLTARAHHLSVQFTFFAFTPEVFGGANPYLDPEALRRQKEFIAAIVTRFRDFDFVAWDLINEPSFSNSKKTWQTRPNGDPFELRAWNDWLAKKYPSRSALAEAWRSVTVPDSQPVPLPSDEEFSNAAAYSSWPSGNSLRAMDYLFFAQDAFRDWAAQTREAIRAAGSTQLVTVGEDEGGGNDRPSPAFFADAVDFTTTHSWWAFDSLLWDSLVAKVRGKPMLVQETGVSREARIDGEPHRTPTQETALFKKKLAVSAGTGAGAIEWLWNVNDYMRDDREATIGAIRPDGTEKGEAQALREFGKFAAAAGPHLTGAIPPQVAIATSQVLQFSPLQRLALEAQQKAVRALNVDCGIPAEVITENNVARDLANSAQPKLVILPSPQALSDEAWSALLEYVNRGGTLLVTGSVERDAHRRVTRRFASLGIDASPQAILSHTDFQEIGSESIQLSFSAEKQSSMEGLRFADGRSFHIIKHGSGKILAARDPVELSEGDAATRQLYTEALSQAGIKPPFIGKLPPGVMVRPTEFADSVLYLIVSDSAENTRVNLRDIITRATIDVDLPAGAAKLLLLTKVNGAVLARFGD